MTLTIITAGLPPMLTAGDIALDVMTRELHGPAGQVRLSPGPFVVMRELMRRAPAVVTKGALIGAVWPDPDLERGDPLAGVRRFVMELRRALGVVGAPGKRLRLHHLEGYSVQPSRQHHIRVLSSEQAALVDQLLASQQTAEIAPCA